MKNQKIDVSSKRGIYLNNSYTENLQTFLEHSQIIFIHKPGSLTAAPYVIGVNRMMSNKIGTPLSLMFLTDVMSPENRRYVK